MLVQDMTKTWNGVCVKEYFLHKHNTNKIDLPPRRLKPIVAITIHNTDDLARVEEDAEQYTRATVNGNMNTVRTHFYVDDINAWQNLDTVYCNWTNTDGSGMGNTQTISVEVIMHDTNKEHDETAFENAAKLTAYLLHKFNLPSDAVVTHTYWLHVRDKHTTWSTDAKVRDEWCTKPHPYKTCPFYIIPRWDEFKKKVAMYYGFQEEHTLPQEKYRILTAELNVRSKPGTGPDSKVLMTVKMKEIYTIVEIQMVGDVPWGRLKSGAGWISLLPKYVEKLTN